jgi:hypothetical protein
MLNRTRIWIICFNVDKSTATQFGKPSTLREDQCVTSFPDFLPCLLANNRELASYANPTSGTNPPSTTILWVINLYMGHKRD